MPNALTLTALDADGARQTFSTNDSVMALIGALADAAAANGASGSMLAYLRAIKDGVTSTTPSPVLVNNPSYEPVAASASAQVMGSTGAVGDILSHVVIIPASTSPGAVSITDGSGSAITVFAGGASSVTTLIPFTVPLGLPSANGAWKITTGASVSAIGVGRFT